MRTRSALAVVATAAGVMVALAQPVSAIPVAPASTTYTTSTTFDVPDNICALDVVVAGASGASGGNYDGTGGAGGAGGEVSAQLLVASGSTAAVDVGDQGQGGTAGASNGGNGGSGLGAGGGGGGGSSDIGIDGVTVVVAGGGGGGGAGGPGGNPETNASGGPGGDAGSPGTAGYQITAGQGTGENASPGQPGTSAAGGDPGSQTAPPDGAGSFGETAATAGTASSGGAGGSDGDGGGGGGGGYFGGGGGAPGFDSSGAGGGGGSNLVPAGGTVIGTNTGDGSVTVTELTCQSIAFTAASPVTVGDNGSLTATATSGEPVTFTVDPATSPANACTVSGPEGASIAFSAAGSCVIDANQAGDELYAPAPQAQQVIAVEAGDTNPPPPGNGTAPSTETVASSPNPSVTGQAVTVTAATTTGSSAAARNRAAKATVVSGGTAQLSIDGVTVGQRVAVTNGMATFPPLTRLRHGKYMIRVDYSGTSGISSSTGLTTQRVKKAATTTSLTSSGRHVKVHVVPVAPGTGTPTGEVTLSIGQSDRVRELNSDGIAKFHVGHVNGRALTATYAGDKAYKKSTS